MVLKIDTGSRGILCRRIRSGRHKKVSLLGIHLKFVKWLLIILQIASSYNFRSWKSKEGFPMFRWAAPESGIQNITVPWQIPYRTFQFDRAHNRRRWILHGNGIGESLKLLIKWQTNETFPFQLRDDFVETPPLPPDAISWVISVFRRELLEPSSTYHTTTTIAPQIGLYTTLKAPENMLGDKYSLKKNNSAAFKKGLYMKMSHLNSNSNNNAHPENHTTVAPMTKSENLLKDNDEIGRASVV